MSAAEDARNVLEEEGSGSVSPHKVKPGDGEAAAVVTESPALSGDAEPLARWPPCPDIGAGPIHSRAGSIATTVGTACSCIVPRSCGIWMVRSPCVAQSRDIPEVGDVGPVAGEDGAGVGLDLGMGDDAEPGSLEAHVESSDAGEPTGDGGGGMIAITWLNPPPNSDGRVGLTSLTSPL
jgi:hypothetical protein